jgi:hypothetical protein
MCIKGLTQPSCRTTGPVSNLPEPLVANPGITDDVRRTIAETMADGTGAGTHLATAVLDDTVGRRGPAAPRRSMSRPSIRAASRLRRRTGS